MNIDAYAMHISDLPPAANHLQIGPMIAQGGMATVFEAMDEHGNRVAAKLPHETMMANPVVMERFLREASLLCTIASPYIVRGYGLFRHDDGRPLLVMDRLYGEDLGDILRGCSWVNVPRAVTSTIHACAAVAELHACGVVHRDLKPSNLFVTDAPDGLGPTVLLDLGVARARGPHPPVTQAGCVVGSPAYMAPEQMMSQEDLDHRADVWSLGVVLFELLTGRVPFEGKNMMRVLSSALLGDRARLMDYRPDLLEAIDDIIGRCLAPDPDDRWESALALAWALVPTLPIFHAHRAERELREIEASLALRTMAMDA